MVPKLHRCGALAVFVVMMASARHSRADEASESCTESFARAQRREEDGLVTAARELYSACAHEDCAETTRSDCSAALRRLDHEDDGRSVLGPVILGVGGGVALIVAAVLHSNATGKEEKADDLRDAPPGDVLPGENVVVANLTEAERLRRDADRLDTAAVIVAGVGVAAILGAFVWYWAMPARKTAVAPIPPPSFAVSGALFRF
jgi:hypothetical protein